MEFEGVESAAERYNERITDLTEEEAQAFHKGYLSSTADAIVSLESILDSADTDEERVAVIRDVLHRQRGTITLAEIALGTNIFQD